jgi:hypothetical protein
VLVQMNSDNPVGNDSDNSSPEAQALSEMRDEDDDSSEASPPPQENKRNSNNSSAYSRSYQSVFSADGAPAVDYRFGHYRQWSTSSSNRPTTANTSIADSYRDEDPQDLAAAVGLLSCSYGTPKSGPTGMPSDVPPVPPLPAKYASALYTYRGQADVNMDNSSSDDEVEQHHHHHHIHEDDEGLFGKMDA